MELTGQSEPQEQLGIGVGYLYHHQVSIKLRRWKAVISGPRLTTESHGQLATAAGIIGFLCLYPPRDNIKPWWLMTAIYGPLQTTALIGVNELLDRLGIGTGCLYQEQDSIKARWLEPAVTSGSHPTLEYHGHPELHPEVWIGVECHYQNQASIKPQMLMAEISGPLPTME